MSDGIQTIVFGGVDRVQSTPAEFVAQYAGQKSPIDLSLNRSDLADLFACWGLTRGAEIGVERGLYSEVLCKANPQLELLCVDAWRTYDGYREHVSQEQLDGFYEEVAQRLSPYRVKLMRMFSADAETWIPDGSLDFVYIDANHRLEHVIADLAAWVPKVRPGGIVAGHDYRKVKGDGLGKGRVPMHVPQALTAWTNAYCISPLFVLRGDRAPSWFWVVK